MDNFLGVILILIMSVTLLSIGMFRLGSSNCCNEELTFNYEINFKGNECKILNDKFVICKYKTLDDLEITDFEGVTTNGKDL